MLLRVKSSMMRTLAVVEKYKILHVSKEFVDLHFIIFINVVVIPEVTTEIEDFAIRLKFNFK